MVNAIPERNLPAVADPGEGPVPRHLFLDQTANRKLTVGLPTQMVNNHELH